ncbi:MAG: cell division FtsK/SpoIIIE [Frankiales bacterium]|nr:cell division FtsK/SpoIIIE [Frankiales bacterium]
MELPLTLLAPDTGARVDVLVDAENGTGLGEVAGALLDRVLPGGRDGHEGWRVWVDGAPVPSQALLGAAPLVRGALLVVSGPQEDVPPTRRAGADTIAPGRELTGGPVRLHVVGGPDAGAVHAMASALTALGRGEGVDLCLDDDQVSRLHCRLVDTPAGVRVHDTGSANGTTVDGDPVGEEGTVLAPGALLRVGTSTLTVGTPPPLRAPLEPTGDGRLSFNRPPRLRSRHAPVQVVVPAPPKAPERPPVPLLAVLAPLVLGIVMWRVTGSTTFLLFTLLSPVLVVGGFITERRTGRRASRASRALWRAQREVAEQTLAAAVREDELGRRRDHPDAVEAIAAATGPGVRLWERRRSDDDLLDLRLGLADQAARVEAEGDLDEGDITARAVPVVVPLASAGVLGIAGPRHAGLGLARWVVAQSAVWHSPRDLSIVVLASPATAPDWEWAGPLPHCVPDDGQGCRALLGLSAGQRAARVRELTALLEQRQRTAASRSTPVRRVLLVVDGARALRNLPGLAHLLAEGPAVGIHGVCVESDVRLLPEACSATAVLGTGAELEVRQPGQPGPTAAVADLLSEPRARLVARALAPLRDDTRDAHGGGALPVAARWTEAVGIALSGGASDVEQVLAHWGASDGGSTRVVLGQGSDGVLAVDLCDDGPHALVAGTTGSGKSELLQTLLASLALGNRPDELTFVLVDYKGGAAFGPCARLPHTVGLVTDLDGSLVERALSSLTAELTRREALLKAHGAKDLEDYRLIWAVPPGASGHPPRGVAPLASPPTLPRLVLVVDEFASLAEELPDFVRGLVGIAMRGRSLGVHLVLATQRPEGVVSADIRANTNLRICLAVTRDSESRDVLDSPVAATISRSTPGRGFVRTGHSTLSAFQAGRVGGRRPAKGPAPAVPTVEVLPAAELGDAPPRPAGDSEVEGEGEADTDLTLLVEACAGAAVRLGLEPQPSPWLPPLPDLVLIGDLPPVEDPLAGAPGRVPPLAYGLLDLPAEQRRASLVLDLDRSSHLMVIGSPRAGRTTTLRAIAAAVAAAASADDVHLHALDFGGGGLAALAALPHTGAVVTPDQPERVDRLLTWLGAEVVRRQRVLAEAGCSGLLEQRSRAAPEDRMPHLLVLLDRWEAFLAAYQDLDAGRLVDLVLRVVREGPSAGIQLVITADRSGAIGRMGSLVEERLLLRLADRGDYAALGVPSRSVPGELGAGRGWSLGREPVVAQVALIDADPAGPAQAARLRREAAVLGRAARPPRRFEPLPSTVRRADLPPHPDPAVLVVGVGGDDLGAIGLDAQATGGGVLVAGPPGSGRSTALLTFSAALAPLGLPVVAVAPRPSLLRELPGCLSDPADPGAAALLEARLVGRPAVLLVDDAELLLDTPLAPVLERIVRRARDTGTVVIVAGTTEDLLGCFRGFVVDLRRSRTGLLLCPQSAADGDLLGVRLSRATGGEVVPGRALLSVRGQVQPLQVAAP